jgi:hypothetical protein
MRWLAVAVFAFGCGTSGPPPVRSGPRAERQPPAPEVNLDVDSADVLGRTDESAEVVVKHVLLGWSELADVYQGRLDPRAQARSQRDAAQLATLVADRLRLNATLLDAMIDQYSEDPGRREDYTVTPDAPFVPEFKALALRLRESEVGIVKTKFGYHVIVRVPLPMHSD